VVFDAQGQRIALFLGWTALSAVEPATGKVRWSIPHRGSYEVVADPVVAGNQVFFATLSRCTVIAYEAQGSPRVLWSGETLREGNATPVVVDGYLYGSDWDTFVDSWDWKAAQRREWPFRCIEVKSGKVAWTRPMGYVSLMAADGKLIMLDLKGTLSIAEASPQQLTVLSSADVFAGANKPRLFPTAPVLCNGKIYCRNYAGDLQCIDAR
jgi:outer membrane protein assembly factor BamB